MKQNIPEDIKKEVNNFISNVFPSERFNEIKFLKTKEKVDVEQIVNKIFKEEKLNFVDTQEITKLIIKKRSRRLLLNELKNFLNKNKNFNLSDNAYDTLYDIFKECINLVQHDKDYETAKIIIMLSKDIFREIDEENEDKICLVSDLKNETLKIVNTELLYGPKILCLGIYLKRTESKASKKYLCHHIYNSITYNSQIGKATQGPNDERKQKR